MREGSWTARYAAGTSAASPTTGVGFANPGRNRFTAGIITWISGPIPKAYTSVPIPALPPRINPFSNTVISIAVRTTHPAFRTETVRTRLKIRLEDRLEHQFQRGLHDPVRGRRNS